MNLYGYHLPLDVHPELGNNAQLAKLLDIENLQPLEKGAVSIPVWGELKEPMTGENFAEKIEKVLNRKPLICIENGPHLIRKLVSAPVADKVILILRQNKAAMHLLLVKCQNKRFILPVSKDYISSLLAITQQNDMVSSIRRMVGERIWLDVEFKDIDNPA